MCQTTEVPQPAPQPKGIQLEEADHRFQITSGVGQYDGCLFAIRKVRSDRMHQMLMWTPAGTAKMFALRQEYFLQPENIVRPSLELAKFCSYLRMYEGAKDIYLWMAGTPDTTHPTNAAHASTFGGSGVSVFLGEMVKRHGWIGVDLDGTLAEYDAWKGINHIGEPIPLMVDRVREWLYNGHDVRIFTSRVSVRDDPTRDASKARDVVEKWCEKHIGLELPVTNVKDFRMQSLWDDRVVQVQKNTGLTLPDLAQLAMRDRPTAEQLGRWIREGWIEGAKQYFPEPLKPSWISSYDELGTTMKLVDDCMGSYLLDKLRECGLLLEGATI